MIQKQINTDTVKIEEVINLMLSHLYMLQVKDDDGIIIDMGEPDYTILGSNPHIKEQL